jgi:DNA-binding LacI/PurR family transcriptional regulator
VDPFPREIGLRAAGLLLEGFAGTVDAPRTIRVEPVLVPRESSARSPTG